MNLFLNKKNTSFFSLTFFFSTFFINAFAIQKVSGKDFLDTSIRYETNSIKSFGRTVMGNVFYTRVSSDKTSIKTTDKYILFCASNELFQYESSSDIYSNEGVWIKSYAKSESKDSTRVISHERSDLSWLRFSGVYNYYLDLQSRCTNSSTKLPRIEIPIARSEGVVFHAILDTFLEDGRLKHVWVKDQKIFKTEVKDKDGKTIETFGEILYDFRFVEPRNYSMARYALDCKNEKISISQLIEYSSKGDVLKSEKTELNNLRLDPVIPNSVGESIHKFACNL